MKNTKSQISIIEIIFIILLLSVFFSYYSYNPDMFFQEKEYKNELNTIADSIYYSENYRDLIINENLTNNSIDYTKWNNFNQTISKLISNYEIIIRENNLSKNIFNCSGKIKNREFVERIIFCNNLSTVCKFRKIQIGGCY